MYLSKIFNEKNLTITDQAIVSGGNFALNILIARVLSLNDLGTFSLCWLALLLASSIHQAFLLGACPTAISRRKEATAKEIYVHHLAILNLGTVLTSFLATYALSLLFFSKAQLNGFFPITLALLVSSYLFFDFGRKMNQNLSKTKRTLIADGIVLVVQLATMAVLFYAHNLDLISLLASWALIYSVAGLVLNFAFLVKIKSNLESLVPILIEHWNYGKWLMATGMIQWFSGNIYTITAAAILGNAAAGVIRLLQNIVGVLHILFISFEIYIPVKAAEIYLRQGTKSMVDYVVAFAVQGMAITIAVVLLICTFSTQILQLFYKGDVTESSLLCFFAIFYLIVFSAIPLRIILRTVGNTRALFIAYVISLLISLVIAKPLITQYGTTGVLLGFLISNVVTNIYYIIAAHKHIWSTNTHRPYPA